MMEMEVCVDRYKHLSLRFAAGKSRRKWQVQLPPTDTNSVSDLMLTKLSCVHEPKIRSERRNSTTNTNGPSVSKFQQLRQSNHLIILCPRHHTLWVNVVCLGQCFAISTFTISYTFTLIHKCTLIKKGYIKTYLYICFKMAFLINVVIQLSNYSIS